MLSTLLADGSERLHRLRRLQVKDFYIFFQTAILILQLSLRCFECGDFLLELTDSSLLLG